MRIKLGVLAAFTLFAGSAGAQGRDPATAEALFRMARGAVDRGDFASACPKFEESNRLDPAVGTEFNLADCDEHIGKIVSAWTLFEAVAQRLPRGDDRIALARGRAAALEPKLPRLILRAGIPMPNGAVILRDGVELGSASFGVPLPVDPGPHVIVLKAPGHVDWEQSVRVAIGETTEVALQVGALAPVAKDTPGPVVTASIVQPPPLVEGDRGRTRRTVAISLLGLGGAGLVAGVVTGAIALSAKNTVSSECDSEKHCSQAGIDAGDRGRTAATISTVTFGIGLVGGLAGSYLLLTGKKDTAPTVGATFLPGGGMIAFRTRIW